MLPFIFSSLQFIAWYDGVHSYLTADNELPVHHEIPLILSRSEVGIDGEQSVIRQQTQVYILFLQDYERGIVRHDRHAWPTERENSMSESQDDSESKPKLLKKFPESSKSLESPNYHRQTCPTPHPNPALKGELGCQ